MAILIGREWVWLNAVTGEGVLWVLTLFVWVVAEETWQHDHGILPLLPSAKQWQTAWQTLASAVVRYYRRINVWTVTVYGWTIGIASVFFGLVSVIILVAFVMPAAFGLQNFNQWGGMYDDHWCHVEVYSDSPHAVTGSELSFELENAGETQTKWVYTTPMHNQGTCLMWAKTRCGQQSNGGWAIRWVNAYMLETHFAGVDNICDMDLPQASRWFPHGN